MPDTSLTIDYTIASLTNSADAMTTVVWSMSHVGTGLTENRTGDKFKTDDLVGDINTTDDDGSTKIEKVKTNFEAKALPYFNAFAKRVRLAQEQADVAYLDDIVDEVTGLSMGGGKPISGSVKVS